MAGRQDWIPIDREIVIKMWFVKMKSKIKASRNELLGALTFVWFWADRGDNVDGHAARSGDAEYLDAFAELDGLYAAMEKEKLIRTEDDKLIFVNYFANKERMHTRARVQRHRDKDEQAGNGDDTPNQDDQQECNATDTPCNASDTPNQDDQQECNATDTPCNATDTPCNATDTPCNASDMSKAKQSKAKQSKGEERKELVEGGVAYRCNKGGVGGKLTPDGIDWTLEFIKQVRTIANDRFGPLTQPHAGYLREDRATILQIAACEALGLVSERWVPESLAALRDRLSPDSMSKNGPVKNHVRWVFGSLKKTAQEKCGRTYEQILGPVQLPQELAQPPPRNG